MQKIVILLNLVTIAFAGVGVLTPEIEAEALRLWQAHCESGEGGTDGSTSIYCKKSGEKLEEALTHELTLKPSEEQKDQVIFVQPPSYLYKHDVVVTGGGGAGGKTVIYVKPAKNTHEVNIQDQTSASEGPAKPTLYFLKGDHGGAGGGDSSAGSAPAPAGYTAAEEEAPPAPDAPAPDAPADGTRKRRENGHDALVEPERKRTVYILRRMAA